MVTSCWFSSALRVRPERGFPWQSMRQPYGCRGLEPPFRLHLGRAAPARGHSHLFHNSIASRSPGWSDPGHIETESSWVTPSRATVTRILVVEDQKDLALGLQANLEVEGYEVLVAHTGEHGLSKATSGQPDLV